LSSGFTVEAVLLPGVPVTPVFRSIGLVVPPEVLWVEPSTEPVPLAAPAPDTPLVPAGPEDVVSLVPEALELVPPV